MKPGSIRDKVREWLGMNLDARVAHERQVSIHDHIGRVEAQLDRIEAALKPRPENPRIRAATYIDWDTAQVMALRDLEKEN